MKKILISHRRAGLGDCLIQAANSWFWAKKNNLRLYVAWYRSLYLEEKNLNAFFFLFDFPQNLEGVEIIKQNKINIILFQILRITLRILKRFNFDTSNFRYLCKYIIYTDGTFSPKPELKPFFDSLKLKDAQNQKFEEFLSKNFSGKKIIGLHVRYYPISLKYTNHSEFWINEEKTLNHIAQVVRDEQRMYNYDCFIFLSTDSIKVQKFLQKKLENVIIYKPLKPIINTNKEKHYQINCNSIEDTLIEMFLLSRCQVLMRYTNSWFAYYASLYADKVIEIGKPADLETNFS